MTSLFAGELAGSQVVHEVQSIQLVGTDGAGVISNGTILLAGQTEPDAATRAVDTWVLARADDTCTPSTAPPCQLSEEEGDKMPTQHFEGIRRHCRRLAGRWWTRTLSGATMSPGAT